MFNKKQQDKNQNPLINTLSPVHFDIAKKNSKFFKWIMIHKNKSVLVIISELESDSHWTLSNNIEKLLKLL